MIALDFVFYDRVMFVQHPTFEGKKEQAYDFGFEVYNQCEVDEQV